MNWDYLGVLKDKIGFFKLFDSVWDDHSRFNNPETIESTLFVLDVLDEEIKFDSESDRTLVNHDSKNFDTRALVDRFMIKQGRKNSSVEIEIKETKRPKVEWEKKSIGTIGIVENISPPIIVCPTFDNSKAKKLKYVANSKFFGRRELVDLLENKFSIQLIERNLDYGTSNIEREDLIADEKTCILYNI